MMNEKQVEALRLAREALERLKRAFFKDAPDSIEQWESEWVVPAMNAITAIDEALMSVSDGAQERSSEEQPAQVDPCIDGSCSCCWTHLDEQPAHVAAVNTSSERVDKTAENVHEQPAQPSQSRSDVKPWVHASTWLGLTDEQIAPIIQQYHWLPIAFARAIEAKLRELNEHKEKNA